MLNWFLIWLAGAVLTLAILVFFDRSKVGIRFNVAVALTWPLSLLLLALFYTAVNWGEIWEAIKHGPR